MTGKVDHSLGPSGNPLCSEQSRSIHMTDAQLGRDTMRYSLFLGCVLSTRIGDTVLFWSDPHPENLNLEIRIRIRILPIKKGCDIFSDPTVYVRYL